MAVLITIKRGKCQGDFHKIGDTFTIDSTTPAGMCLGAWNAVSPYVVALLFGANFPWEQENGVAKIHCADPKGITLELKRVED